MHIELAARYSLGNMGGKGTASWLREKYNASSDPYPIGCRRIDLLSTVC